MAVSPAHLRQTATSFLSAFDTLSAQDHLALRAATCTHIFAPASLLIPPKSNHDFENHINGLLPLLSAFRVEAKETHVHATSAGGQVTIWVNGSPVFRPEAMDGDDGNEWAYTGEYIFVLDVNEKGEITRVLEFLDSLATERLRGLMERARKNLRTR